VEVRDEIREWLGMEKGKWNFLGEN
jgi:hypothetical protein